MTETMKILLNVVTIFGSTFALVSLLAFIFASRKQEAGPKIRRLAAVFSSALFVLALALGVVYATGRDSFVFSVSSENIGSMWSNLIACFFSTMLIYENNENETGRHNEATLFTIMCYAQCALGACYMCYLVTFFGPEFTFSCVVSDSCVNAILSIFALLIWVYTCMTAGMTNKWVKTASKVFMVLVCLSVLFLATNPFTNLVIEPDYGTWGTSVTPLYAVPLCVLFVVAACVGVACLRSKLDAMEKVSLLALVVTVPFIFLLDLVAEFYVEALGYDIALTFCYLGIANRRAHSMQRHMSQVDMAKDIQQGMLPQSFPDDPRFRVYAHMWPAREVAGDFYDFYQVDDEHLYITVADVSGKDVPAAMFMAKAHALIREYESQGIAPNKILDRVNRAMAEGNSEKLFVTVWIGKMNLRIGLLTYANAGHNPPILVTDGDASVQYLRSKVNLILGIRKRTKYARQTLLLHKRDRIMLYTDGVTESINAKEEQYGEDRLLAFTKSSLDMTGKQAVEGVFESVNQFAEGMEQFDDITVLCASYHGDADTTAFDFSEAFFAPDTKNLYKLIDFVDKECLALGYPQEHLPMLEVCAEEVFADIAHFAYRGIEEKKDVRVSIARTRDEINVQFSDNGSPFNPLCALGSSFIDRARASDDSRLGIILVDRLMDDVRYEFKDGENRLTIAKSLDAQAGVKEGAQ